MALNSRYIIHVELHKSRRGFRNDYRFGFNGKEKDNEIKGTGNSLDFGARIYDSRLGRWFSVDPWHYKYVWQSSYAYYRNNPISTIDYKGKGKYYYKTAKEVADDGLDDGKKYITNDKEELKKAASKNGCVDPKDMKKSVLLPKNNPFPKLLEKTLKPNTNLSGNSKGDDSKGGQHEESTVCTWEQNYEGKPGKANKNLADVAEGEPAVETTIQTTDVNGNEVPQNNTVILIVHTHPTESGDVSSSPTNPEDWQAQRELESAGYLAPNATSAVLSADNLRNSITFYTTQGKKNITLFSIDLNNINKIYEAR
jgi:RHS repeat-associated protein